MRKTIKRLTRKEIAELISFRNEWHRFDKAYFWSSNGNAHQRWRYEDDNSQSIKFDYRGVKYTLEISIRCSCKNVYATRSVYVDGSRRTIRELNKLIPEIMT